MTKQQNDKSKPCLVACSVLKDEIQQLKRQGDLDVDVVFVSKFFHVDYTLVEKNLRAILERTMPCLSEKPILVYGDLCLGPNGEMKQLAKEYGIIKIDALNCVDCILGGHGKVDEADPNHEFMFMDPGMIEFFRGAQEKLKQEGMDEEAIRNMFGGIKGIILLDTLGNAEKCKADIESLHMGLDILETKEIGLGNVKRVISDAIKQSKQNRS